MHKHTNYIWFKFRLKNIIIRLLWPWNALMYIFLLKKSNMNLIILKNVKVFVARTLLCFPFPFFISIYMHGMFQYSRYKTKKRLIPFQKINQKHKIKFFYMILYVKQKILFCEISKYIFIIFISQKKFYIFNPFNFEIFNYLKII